MQPPAEPSAITHPSVLEVEIAGRLTHADCPRWRRCLRVATVDNVGEQGYRPTAVRVLRGSRLRTLGARCLTALSIVDRQRQHPLLVLEQGHMLRHRLCDLGAVLKGESRGCPSASFPELDRTGEPFGDRPGEICAGDVDARGDHGGEQNGHDEDDTEPLRARLPAFASQSLAPHANEKPAKVCVSRTRSADTVSE